MSDLPRYTPVKLVGMQGVPVSVCECGVLVPAEGRDAHDQWHALIAELLRGKGSQ